MNFNVVCRKMDWWNPKLKFLNSEPVKDVNYINHLILKQCVGGGGLEEGEYCVSKSKQIILKVKIITEMLCSVTCVIQSKGRLTHSIQDHAEKSAKRRCLSSSISQTSLSTNGVDLELEIRLHHRCTANVGDKDLIYMLTDQSK